MSTRSSGGAAKRQAKPQSDDRGKPRQKREVSSKPQGEDRGKPKQKREFSKPRSGGAAASTGRKRLPTVNKAAEAAKRLKAASETQRDARHELVVRCNKLWNDLRSKELEKEKRSGLCVEIFKLLKGKVLSFAQRPDTSRVIQTIFKYGDENVRKGVLEELSSEFAVLSKGKYSSFLVISLLRHGNEAERGKIASELREHVRSMGTHANGARVINFCLTGSPASSSEEDVISEAEKKRFYERFYGSELTLLHQEGAKPSNSLKDCDLSQYLPQKDEAKRSAALQPLKKLVLKIAEKGLLRFPFAQFLCWQVVSNANREDIADMIPSISEAALAMVGTWEGSRAVARCLIGADAKDRKKIIKEWKGHVVDLCAHKFGWYPVCRALDSVDDTKFIEKAIIEELTSDGEKLKGLIMQEDGFGRKAFLRVLAPEERSHTYFAKYDETFKSDPASLSTSKKDAAVRNQENFAKLREPLIACITSNAVEFLKDSRATDVIRELLSRLLVGLDKEDEERTKVLQAVADAAPNCMEDARGHATLKRVVKDEAEYFASAPSGVTSFAELLAKKLAGKMVELAKINRAAFVLDALVNHPRSKALTKKGVERRTLQTVKGR